MWELVTRNMPYETEYPIKIVTKILNGLTLPSQEIVLQSINRYNHEGKRGEEGKKKKR